MNPDMKRSWIEALRSGDYIQGSSLSFCVWDESMQRAFFSPAGVAVDLFVDEAWTSEEGEYFSKGINLLQFSDLFDLPYYRLAEVEYKGVQGYSFKDIADYIEREM